MRSINEKKPVQPSAHLSCAIDDGSNYEEVEKEHRRRGEGGGGGRGGGVAPAVRPGRMSQLQPSPGLPLVSDEEHRAIVLDIKAGSLAQD